MRTPLKDRPFSSWSDEKLKQYIQLFQDFSTAYKRVDTEKQKLASSILKDLFSEKLDRQTEDFEKNLEENVNKNGLKPGVFTVTPKKVLKKLKKSIDKPEKV